MLAPFLFPRTPNGRILGHLMPQRKVDGPPERIYHGDINFEPIGAVETDISWKDPMSSAEQDFRNALTNAQRALDRPVDFGDLKLRFPNLPNSIKLIYPLPKTTTESTPWLTEENAPITATYHWRRCCCWPRWSSSATGRIAPTASRKVCNKLIEE